MPTKGTKVSALSDQPWPESKTGRRYGEAIITLRSRIPKRAHFTCDTLARSCPGLTRIQIVRLLRFMLVVTGELILIQKGTCMHPPTYRAAITSARPSASSVSSVVK